MRPWPWASASAPAHLRDDVEHTRRRHRAEGGHQLTQRRPVHVLHGVVERPVGGAAEIVDGNDVRVGELAGGLHLPFEAHQRLVPPFHAGQELHRGAAPEHGVAGEVDHAHATPPDATLQGVLAQLHGLFHLPAQAEDHRRSRRRCGDDDDPPRGDAGHADTDDAGLGPAARCPPPRPMRRRCGESMGVRMNQVATASGTARATPRNDRPLPGARHVDGVGQEKHAEGQDEGHLRAERLRNPGGHGGVQAADGEQSPAAPRRTT